MAASRGQGPTTASGKCKYGRAKTGPNKGKCRKTRVARKK